MVPATLFDLADEAYCYLTTTGRHSGAEHTIEIWFAARPPASSLYLISGGGDDADWVRNLLAHPEAAVRITDQQAQVRARLPMAPDDERDRAVRLLHGKYSSQVSGSLTDWQADAFIVALDLLDRP